MPSIYTVGKLFLFVIALATPLQANVIPQSWHAKGEVFLLEGKSTIKTIAQPNSSQLFLAQSLNQQQIQAQQHLKQGTQYYQARQFEAAIKAWQQALSLFQQLKDPSKEALVLGRLGLAQQTLGDPRQAIRYFNQALPILRQTDEQTIEASVLGNLGNNYLKVGRYADAIAAYNQSITLWQQLKNLTSEGQARRGLGNVYIALGQYPEALKQHEQGLKIAQRVNSPEALANAYNSRGVIYSSQGQEKQARQDFQMSFKAAQNIKDPNQQQTLQAQALNNLGNIDLSQDNPSSALQYYQQGLAIAQAVNDRRLEVSALQGIGSVYTSQDQNSQALTLLQKSLALLKNLNDPRLEATNLHLMGANLWKLGRLSEAETYFNSAVNLLDNLRENLADIDKVSIFDTQIHSYALLRRVLAEQGKVEAALEASERGRARAFIELLNKRLAANRSSSASVQNRLPNLQELRQVAKQQNATLVEYAYIADEAFVAQGKRHGAFIKIYIWVVQPNGNIAFREVNLTPAQSQLLTKAGVWANEWKRDRDREAVLKQEFSQLHQNLYGILIAPIADLLPPDPDAPVIFIPYRELFQVSFPALQGPDGTYLVQKHTVLTAPAIQVLALTHQRSTSPPSTNALIIGNPKMPAKQPGETPLRQLPGSEREAQRIGQILQSPTLIGPSATETSIKQRMESAQIIHFATHGLLGEFGTSGVPGAIALAPDSRNDGLLTSDEILDLNLNADLVVVSACDTGRGHLTGDGVVGLSRSLMATGVPSVMITLWEIADDSTAMLMSEFYQQYAQNPNKAQALRQAMLTTMQKHQHPVHWAPFTLVGNAQ